MAADTTRGAEAAARITAYLDARDAGLAHVPAIGPGVITGWPRTLDDADGEFELTATDLRTVLDALASAQERVAELERKLRCGRTDPGGFIGTTVGPCMLEHCHPGMHEEGAVPGFPTLPGARWGRAHEVDADA